jgi:hypothetical protein
LRIFGRGEYPISDILLRLKQGGRVPSKPKQKQTNIRIGFPFLLVGPPASIREAFRAGNDRRKTIKTLRKEGFLFSLLAEERASKIQSRISNENS